MRRIPLSTGRQTYQPPAHWALVDNGDYKALRQFNWTFRPCKRRVGYAYRVEYGETILMHRAIMQAGPDEVVTHQNKNGLDNRRENLIKRIHK